MTTSRSSKKRPREESKEAPVKAKRPKMDSSEKKQLPPTLCKIKHPDILLAFCESGTTQAKYRLRQYGRRNGFEVTKNLLTFFGSNKYTSVLISAVNNPYGTSNYRQKHEMAVKLLLSAHASEGNLDKIWQDIPEASAKQESDVLALFNQQWVTKLTISNESSYFASFASVRTLTAAPFTLSSVFFNLRRILHYPEIGWVFITPTSKQATNARSNMMKPSRLGLTGSDLTLVENLLFIVGEKKNETVNFDKFFKAATKFQAGKNAKIVPTIDQFKEIIWDATSSEEEFVVSKFKQKFKTDPKRLEAAQSAQSQLLPHPASASSLNSNNEVKNLTAEPMHTGDGPKVSQMIETVLATPSTQAKNSSVEPTKIQAHPELETESCFSEWANFFKTKEAAGLMFNSNNELVGDTGIEPVGPFM